MFPSHKMSFLLGLVEANLCLAYLLTFFDKNFQILTYHIIICKFTWFELSATKKIENSIKFAAILNSHKTIFCNVWLIFAWN